MRRRVAILAVTVLLCGACARQPAPQGDAADAAGAADKPAEGVTLNAIERGKLGVETEPAIAATYRPEIAGYGVIISHDAIAQASSELDTAGATARLSSSALARARRLDGTAGAMAADAVDALAGKAIADEAARRLARQKLSAAYGMNPPWNRPGGARLLEQVSDGSSKMLRATFPLGALAGQAPQRLRARRLYADSAQDDWQLGTVWDAPSDSTTPGRSVFALVTAVGAREGERLQVWAQVGESIAGAAIPAAAVIMADDRFWCYVERDAGVFSRVEVDVGKISGDGYFLKQGIEPGDRIVVKAAGQLLARETGIGSEQAD